MSAFWYVSNASDNVSEQNLEEIMEEFVKDISKASKILMDCLEPSNKGSVAVNRPRLNDIKTFSQLWNLDLL